MALDKDTLVSNEVLATLSEDQINKVVELSSNDENSVIAAKTKEIHSRYDSDIMEVLGEQKPHEVKTYDWLKTTILPRAKQGTEAAKKLEAAESKVAHLEKAIKDNTGDETLKKQLKDANDKLETLQSTYEQEKTELEKKYSTKEKEVTAFKVDSKFNNDLKEVTFLDSKILSIDARSSILNSEKKAVLEEYTPEFDKDDDVVYRKKDGTLALNKNNGLKPYTLGELVLERPAVKSILAEKQKSGTGGQDYGSQGGQGDAALDVSGATTQVEASRLIEKHLMKEGISRGTKDFTDARTKLWSDLDVGSLPVK